METLCLREFETDYGVKCFRIIEVTTTDNCQGSEYCKCLILHDCLSVRKLGTIL